MSFFSKIISPEKTPDADCAVVVSDGALPLICGDSGQLSPELALPYGIFSMPPAQSNAVILDAGARKLLAGVLTQNTQNLPSGELLLFSAGGARIHLRNDGKISLNGLLIDADGNIVTGG